MAASENNVTMQTTAEFVSNSTANIKLSKHMSFFSSLWTKFFTKSLADKKLCGGVVAAKVPRKLICYSWFCIAVDCKTQISVVLDNSPERLTWKV